MKFENRAAAGEKLFKQFGDAWTDVSVVYGIANGGVVVAEVIANALSKRLDVAYVSKLPVPWNQEQAFGVITIGGEVLLDEGHYRQIGLSYMEVQKIARQRLSSLKRRYQNTLVEGDAKVDIKDCSVLVVDDGIATGMTALGTIKWLKGAGAKEIFLATPIAHTHSKELIGDNATRFDSLVSSDIKVFAVSHYYREFEQVGDRQVRESIKNNRKLMQSLSE
ncbi:MAG TPA: phosphoribosyltransferase family protein [Caldisericia bacterium]|nr:phosphoribosyltransferase family protein [Caldisericia bacterium]HPF48335.1 phosphoribosyltransferase family protein [Caldisericia bacterium]HPI83486.1 phosphoribosyltransferase family protein [Caldisericia bacterium]HPQ92788.1 phosphoribosyltransferase family protein [Caldisericia bacterium]HRV74114.1 phosphoribosyltransferase family protein [Caldisericia bacterium]